jgi:Flp pilus assembly protein TadG
MSTDTDLAADDTGAFSLFGAITLLALAVMLGFVVEATAQMRAVSRADNLAGEAARAAAQAIDPTLAIPGTDQRIDPAPAVAAAEAYLAETEAEGTVTVSADGTEVTVTVTLEREGLFAPLVPGGRPTELTGTRTATLLTG